MRLGLHYTNFRSPTWPRPRPCSRGFCSQSLFQKNGFAGCLTRSYGTLVYNSQASTDCVQGATPTSKQMPDINFLSLFESEVRSKRAFTLSQAGNWLHFINAVGELGPRQSPGLGAFGWFGSRFFNLEALVWHFNTVCTL